MKLGKGEETGGEEYLKGAAGLLVVLYVLYVYFTVGVVVTGLAVVVVGVVVVVVRVVVVVLTGGV